MMHGEPATFVLFSRPKRQYEIVKRRLSDMLVVLIEKVGYWRRGLTQQVCQVRDVAGRVGTLEFAADARLKHDTGGAG